MAHSFIYTSYENGRIKAQSLITHPLDLIEVTNEKFDPSKKGNKSLTVDATREMIKAAYIAPMSTNKVFLIPNAESMTLNSQNALLKLIEEPPSDVYFFFVTTSPKSLLATILSRCEIVYSNDDAEINTDIYNSLLPLCKALANDIKKEFSQENSTTPIHYSLFTIHSGAARRYALEFALVNLKDEKSEALYALENIFSFTNSEIGDNIIKAAMQKRIAIAKQQIKSNCNWAAICWQLIK